MRRLKQIIWMLLVGMSVLAWSGAPVLQDVRRVNRTPNGDTIPANRNKDSVKAQPVIQDDEEIPDSLLHPRWKIQRTQPVTEEDLQRGSSDLQLPENIEQKVVYNDSLNRYIMGSKMGDSYLGAPFMWTPEEYRRWSERQMRWDFFRSKNSETFKEQGKEKFSFTDMHFDLGPAEKIFGPGGVRINGL